MDAEIEALREMLDPLDAVRFRRMFGGFGVYAGDLMFGLVADGALYLKADEGTAAGYRAEGSEPFGYLRKDGRQVSTSYWRIPERLMDEPEELLAWARTAHGVAARLNRTKVRRGASGRPG